MLPDRSVKPLVLEIKPSLILLILQLSLYGLSLFVILTLINIQLVWQLILFAVISIYVFYIQQHTIGGLLNGKKYTLTLYQNSDWLLESFATKTRGEQKLKLRASSWVSAFIIILHFSTEQNRRIYLSLLSDSLSREDHRKLRVRLHQARFTESEMSAE